MDIKLNTLTITNYDSNNLKKVKFSEELDKDFLIKRYLYNSVSVVDVVKKSENISNLHLGYGYLIKDGYNLVGFIRPYREIIFTLGIDYCVHPNFRFKGYGTKILTEVSDYFLENYKSVNNIKLSVASSNELCLKCASNAGFTLISDNGFEKYKTFMKRK